MKYARRFIPIAAAAVTAMATVTPALATKMPDDHSGEGSITVEKGLAGTTYDAYKIFDLTIGDDGATSYTYTASNTDTPKLLDSFVTGGTYFDVEQIGDTNVWNVKGVKKDSNGKDLYTGLQLGAELRKVIVGSDEKVKQQFKDDYDWVNVPVEPVAGTDYYAGTVSNLPLGYYVVTNVLKDDTAKLQGMLELTITDTNGVVKDKNELPPLEKKIDETDYSQTTVVPVLKDGVFYNVGDVVKYRVESKLPTKMDYTKYIYRFYDTLDKGLTLLKDENGNYKVTVKVDDKELTQGVDYELESHFTDKDGNKVDRETSDHTMAVDFTDVLGHTIDHPQAKTTSYANKYADQATVVIEYEAVVNEEALLEKTEPNTVTLDFSNNPGNEDDYDTEEDHTNVYDIDILINKVNKEKQTLAGASFALYRVIDEAAGTKEYYTLDGITTPTAGTKKGNEGRVWLTQAEYDAVKTKFNNGVTTKDVTDVIQTTGAGGKLNFSGLGKGTYYIEEVKAPNGYNLLTGPIEVKVIPVYDSADETKLIYKSEGVTDYSRVEFKMPGSTQAEVVPMAEHKEEGNPSTQLEAESKVENSSGELPETGGMGTTILTTAGVALMGGAFIILVTKKRVNENK